MKKKTLVQYINEAQHVHVDKDGLPLYSYVNIKEYTGAHNKVPIFCHVVNHGIFTQKPYVHLLGSGCPACGIIRRVLKQSMSQDDFIKRVRVIHNNKYDYIDTVYINNNIKVKIKCFIHGYFYQYPFDHLHGCGCKKCYYDKRKDQPGVTLEEFILKAKLIHGDKYDYSKVSYVNTYTKVTITCMRHGEFEQRPNGHLAGQGCSRCKLSKGEVVIANYLDREKIPYTREYKLDGYNYRYDFYLEGYNLFIEFHGEQHYHTDRHRGGVSGFDKQQRSDMIKVELAKRNGIDLLTISYLEIAQIEEILKYELETKVKDSKIVDISHIYGIYCSIDTKKNNLQRYHDIINTYLRNGDLISKLKRYSSLSNKHALTQTLLRDTLEPYKDRFIRLLSIEHKILLGGYDGESISVA